MSGDDIFRIIYLSRNRLEGSPETVTNNVRQILDIARKRNSQQSVGGVLMFNNGCFLQVLEGRAADVEAAFERIQRDRRHDCIVVLEAKAVDTRMFSDWSMAFVGENGGDRSRFTGFELDAARLAIMAKDQMLAMLQDLVIEEELKAAA